MSSIFSHIVQKRFSQMNEDIATDALAFVLENSKDARNGMMKLLRGILPELPILSFRTQQVEGQIRPDMWGLVGIKPHVFIENKFWAGLTDNQPVSYLHQLAVNTHPAVLLVIAPSARELTLWYELHQRLHEAGITASESDPPAGVSHVAKTNLGPVLAITSWTVVLSALEHATVEDPAARGDLVQLRALCDAADNDAFAPLSLAELSDQRTPAFILQLGAIVQEAVESAVFEKTLSIKGLKPQASWSRIGRYARIGSAKGPGIWLGTHFPLWKAHGGSPLWLVFANDTFGQAQNVRPLLEPWVAHEGILAATSDQEFAVALRLPSGQEKAGVVRAITNTIKDIAKVLAPLSFPTTPGIPQQEEGGEV